MPDCKQPRPVCFYPAVALLALILGCVQFLSIRGETQTYDEGVELAGGYAFLKTGEYRIQPEHPPLAKVLAALPVLALGASVPLDDPSWRDRKDVEFGGMFMFHNRVPADTMLLAARLPSILFTIILAVALALWGERRLGARAALIAMALFCLDPNVIAYGRYLKNDMLLTLLGFLTVIAWLSYLDRPQAWRLVLTGVLAGLACGTKFSAIFLFPALLCLYLLHWRGLARMIYSLAAVCLIAMVALAACYGPEAKALIPMTHSQRLANPGAIMLRDTVNQATPGGKVAAWLGSRTGMRANPLAKGLLQLAEHNADGHDAFLMGMHSRTGWWYYFPVAFLVKTPVATLIAILAACACLLLGRAKWQWSLLIPVLAYLPLCLSTNINTGERHLLPMYPFLFLIVGSAVASFRAVWLSGLALALALESFAIYPHYLAFFNVLVGGPGNGPTYLVDSNIDWGQDFRKLKRYMVEHKLDKICLCALGTADTNYYDIGTEELMQVPDKQKLAETCVMAISATVLQGVYVENDPFGWLRKETPVAKVGYSIYVYDLRKSAEVLRPRR